MNEVWTKIDGIRLAATALPIQQLNEFNDTRRRSMQARCDGTRYDINIISNTKSASNLHGHCRCEATNVVHVGERNTHALPVQIKCDGLRRRF